MKRVVVTGPESTGKTTLASRLARHFGTVFVPEFAREYLSRDGGRVGVCAEEDIEPIARGQIDAEARGAEAARGGLLVCDTDLIVTRIYARHYFGRCPGWIEEEIGLRRYDLHLLLDIDVPWVPDPLRDQGHARPEFRDLFQRELLAHGCKFVEISGDWDARFAKAVEAIEIIRASS